MEVNEVADVIAKLCQDLEIDADEYKDVEGMY